MNILKGDNKDTNSSDEIDHLHNEKLMKQYLNSIIPDIKFDLLNSKFINTVPHLFSHIRQTYIVYHSIYSECATNSSVNEGVAKLE